jgi:hypothetical protein
MYYIVKSSQAENMILKSDLPLSTISTFYKLFNSKSPVSKSQLPSIFLDTIELKNNKLVIENYHLESLFMKWLYNKGKYNSIIIKDWSVSKIKDLYNTFMENYVIKEESVYDSDEEGEDEEEEEEEEEEDSIEDTDINTIIDPPNEINTEVMKPVEDIKVEVKDIKSSIDKAIISGEVVVNNNPDVYPNSIYSSLLLKSDSNFIAINEKISELDLGYIFPKRKNQLSYEYYQEVNSTKVKSADNIFDKFKIIVIFNNSQDNSNNIAILDQTQEFDSVSILKDLASIGLDYITIINMAILPYDDVVESLVKYCKLGDKVNDQKEYAMCLYKINKILSNKSDIKGVLIKSVLEYMHANIKPDFNSSIDFTLLYENFMSYNGVSRINLNIIIDDIMFSKIISFLGYQIKDNKVLYISNKFNNIKTLNFGIESIIQNLLKTSYVAQISHQLRREPSCTVSNNTGPWLQSSKTEFEDITNKFEIKGTII